VVTRPDIIAKPPPGMTPEQIRDARSRAWMFVFRCWHERKGEHHDLRSDSTNRQTIRTDKKGARDADLHGN
jgi:hypothetical protein